MAQHCTVSWLSQHIWCAAFAQFLDQALQGFQNWIWLFSIFELRSKPTSLVVCNGEVRTRVVLQAVRVPVVQQNYQTNHNKSQWKKSDGYSESMAPARKMPRRPSNPGLTSTNLTEPKVVTEDRSCEISWDLDKDTSETKVLIWVPPALYRFHSNT